ncbi:PE-PGRS family protein [Mycobacterium tuberculosis '98-R604 INH-RIF-EM']|nr:PE-PGRS family protein [Mycobacterium tuberculosis '98-R604 INH-RIF-EM']
MSYVLATPEMVAAAANNLAQIGSTLSAANAAALAPTTGVLAAGADEVSAAVASLFSGHAPAYQTLGTQAAAFHERFIQALSTAAGAYGSAEAANASPLQQALNVINAPTQTLLGRPLIGNEPKWCARVPGRPAGPGGFVVWATGAMGGSGGGRTSRRSRRQRRVDRHRRDRGGRRGRRGRRRRRQRGVVIRQWRGRRARGDRGGRRQWRYGRSRRCRRQRLPVRFWRRGRAGRYGGSRGRRRQPHTHRHR